MRNETLAVDKNLFRYDLAIVAILKNEAPYLREWLDYHLLAGVEHFYLYDNDSTDDYDEIIAPYVAAGLVTNKKFSGGSAQFAAYADAVLNYRFQCRRMAFIDLRAIGVSRKLLTKFYCKRRRQVWRLIGNCSAQAAKPRLIIIATCWKDLLAVRPLIGLCPFLIATYPAAMRKSKPLPTRAGLLSSRVRTSRFILREIFL